MARPKSDNSIHEIAREARVSVATVSRVMNNRPDVSEKMRRKVQDVMDKRSYRPRLRSNRRTNLGIIIQLMVPVLEEFAADVLSGIASYAFEQGVETSMLYLPMKQNPPADLVSLLRERRCDAALLLHTPPSLRQIQDLVDSGIPVMLLANQSEIVGLGYVDSDSQAGARQLMRHLFDLGHERIGFLAGEMLDNYDHQQRQATYQHCMKQAGLKIQPNWIVPHQPTNHASEAGYRQALTLLENDASITAIFANNDTMAYGAIWACEEMGRKVPHDISVVGFDDYRASSFFNPPLTTIRQPITTLGYEAAKSVDLVVRGITDQLLQRVMNCELIVRQSSSRANHKP